MKTAKLDIYDYKILPGLIQIELDGNNDPTMVDILSEIDRVNGHIYVEGMYFIMTNNEVFQPVWNKVFLNIHVVAND